MPDEPFPGGLDQSEVRALAVVLADLFEPTADDERRRYVTARQVQWQAIAAMMANGADDRTALQTMLSAGLELLTRGVGPAGAAAQLRRMADQVAKLERR